MNDDIMTDNCAAVRTLSMVRCERVVHYLRSISDYAADSEDARVSMTAFTRLGICKKGISLSARQASNLEVIASFRRLYAARSILTEYCSILTEYCWVQLVEASEEHHYSSRHGRGRSS